ncbi:MAG: FemAB family PEP-CTERM system-associated protein [Deltaproteobacteria bacterium]|nr:FemAB family PEP-CTERM system-associated protein [Deltaproteobacteria bacterium]
MPFKYPVRSRLYSDGDRNRWEDFVEASPDSSLYHRISWKGVIERSFGHKSYYLMAEDHSGAVIGVLPLVHLQSFYFGSFFVSLPYFNYGGVCAATEDARAILIKEAISLASKNNASHIELRHTSDHFDELPSKKAKVSMLLDLPDTIEGLSRSFSSKLRSQIKRPEKEGMRSVIGKGNELENFYSVFARNMRDLGTPVYSKGFFKNILDAFPEASWICTVFHGDTPVASGFLAGFKDRLEIPWASSLREYNRYSPNMLLYWSVLKFACENGYKVFDFGRCTPGENTYKFKEQWGAKPLTHHWHYWMRGGRELPELNPSNPRYRAAIGIWKKLPLSITKLLGPMIVKNIP